MLHIQSTRRDTPGTSAQSTSINDIMDISLRREKVNKKRNGSSVGNVQRLQGLNPCLRCYGTCNEREDRAACLAEPGDPADGASEQPARQDAPRVIHRNGIDRPQKDADERDGDGVPN